MKKENRPNESIVQSKISVKMVAIGILNAGCCLLLGWFLYYMIKNHQAEKVYENWWLDFFIPTLFVAAVCVLCLVTLLYTLVCFHYRLVINKDLRTLTRYSFLHSKGVTIELNHYAGYYVKTKTTRGMLDGYMLRARQELCYLVDSQNYIYQLMSSLAYRNYEQLKEALGLPELTE